MINKEQRKELNGIIREILIKRDKVCLRCGKTKYLQASHIYPKGKYRRLEFEIDNIKFLCNGCHIFWWHKNPIEAMKWVILTVGKPRMDRLKLMVQTGGGLKLDFHLIKLYLLQELAKYE